MQVMLDALNPLNIPVTTKFDIGAAYVDQDRIDTSYNVMVSRFPNVIHLRITTDLTIADADILDCEPSTFVKPTDCPGWVLRSRKASNDPWVYCNETDPIHGWPAVRAAFQSQNVTEPHYWVADYDGQDPAIPLGAIAKQYTANMPKNPYDTSSVVDGIPIPIEPIIDPKPEDEMYGLPHIIYNINNPAAAMLAYPDGKGHLIVNNNTTNSYKAAGSPVVGVDPSDWVGIVELYTGTPGT